MSRRKPLNDALAQNFVYGEETPTPPETPLLPANENQPTMPKTSLLDQLLEQPEPKEPTKRFTVDMPESMHRKLSILAAKSGRKKSEIVRVLLADLLDDIDA